MVGKFHDKENAGMAHEGWLSGVVDQIVEAKSLHETEPILDSST